MWNFDSDYNKWNGTEDKLSKVDFDYYKQELQSVRFWSKCLSGATYLPVNDLTDIYESLSRYQPKNWYVSTLSSPYSVSSIPPENANIISTTSSYYKYKSEYGLTLKNLFTPNRLIKDSTNYFYVDLATNAPINFTEITSEFYIDNVRVLDGHRVLIKDQKTTITLLNSQNPDDFISGNYQVINNFGASIEYEYYDSTNGVYIYQDSNLVRDPILDDYERCKRFSVNVKLGDVNTGRQFHLSRLRDGFFPTTLNSEPLEFTEKKNYLLRNKVDYNNLFETNYYDIVKYPEQSYFLDGITYSIPERTLAIGEFGVIVNTQNGKSNIIKNKYKVDLKSISQTEKYYWICGNDNTLLKVRKHDFFVERIKLEDVASVQAQIIKTDLNSVSFVNELRGVVVGELNTIFLTKNGGFNWERIEVDDFDAYNYTKVIFSTNTNFYISGRNGILIEMVDSLDGWIAYKRRISKKIDDDDEYVLVDDINDMYKTTITTWGASYSYSTASIAATKELLFLAVDNSNIIIHDINNSFSNLGTDFIYLDFNRHYGDIRNITRRETTNDFYFTGTDPLTNLDGIFQFSISNFLFVGTGSSYSNTAVGLTFANFVNQSYPNRLFDYKSEQLFICGNNALINSADYAMSLTFSALDTTFFEKLKSKMLFLDYDIASKLNFFTDDGNYRLPNSVTFSSTQLTNYVDFQPLVQGATAPSYLTQSETNWFTYWADREKTFKYYTDTPMDQSVMVLMSSSFSSTSLSTQLTVSSITDSGDLIKYLAPKILEDNHSRFNSFSFDPISAPTAFYDLYLYKYLMILRCDTNYPVSIGDLMEFKSSVVDKQLVVNRIEILNSKKYIYMFSEFNDNIIKELTLTTQPVTIENLNKYSNTSTLISKFNRHPLSNGYEMGYSDVFGNSSTSTSFVKVSAKFNNLTSYYNLGTRVITPSVTKEMKYTSGFLDFGYSPTYNILTYMESINKVDDFNPKFFATKEYLAMPEFRNIPLGPLDSPNAYIETNGVTHSGYPNGGFVLPGNTILFHPDLFFEWDSVFINTFVDIIIKTTTNTYTTERLLVLDKYYDVDNDYYVMKFHKRLIFDVGDSDILDNGTLDIVSRRTLKQISDDLQELNNIQRAKLSSETWQDEADGDLQTGGFRYYNYERDLNYKIPTDSYAKILLSDANTVENLSAILYVDSKYELAMNITKLERAFEIPISTTSITVQTPFFDAGKLYISSLQKHGLVTGDGIVLEFNGGTGSSQELNQQYFGYQTIIKVTDFDFVVDIDYGVSTFVGNDSGLIKYTKQDPFFGYSPVDIIELGVDKRGKQSIELTLENLVLENSKYRLSNIDFSKFRFRLIDGMNIEILNAAFPWILEAEISGAVIGGNSVGLIWYKGTWECGRWFGGTWISGVWMSGDWYGGTWNSYIIEDKILTVKVDTKTEDNERSIWYTGRWYDGTWTNGVWNDGRWYGGTWQNGLWYGGIWNDGVWQRGNFESGIWVLGTWNGGIFNCNNGPAYWLDGSWNGGDFENGMWYNGTWESKVSDARFGTNAYNSRTATWHAGKWVSGSFYSRLNRDDEGNLDVSDSHKLSIWKTGIWVSGDWWGGIAYNMDWKLGTWHGGILDEIQIVGIDHDDNAFILNGIFKFNIGDEFWITDGQIDGYFSSYGTNKVPRKYKVLTIEESSLSKTTKVYVDQVLQNIGPETTLSSNWKSFNFVKYETGLRIVSRFKTANWKSGIWTNGLFDDGLWEGGIWYEGVFNATWM